MLKKLIKKTSFIENFIKPKIGKLFLRSLKIRLKSYKDTLRDYEDLISKERENNIKDAINQDLKRYHRLRILFNIPEENIDERLKGLWEQVKRENQIFKYFLEDLRKENETARKASSLFEKEHHMNLADTLGEDLYTISLHKRSNLKKIKKLREKKHILKEE